MYSQPRNRIFIIAGFVIGNLLVTALAGYFLYQSRRQYEQRAETSTQNIAQAIDQSLSNSIEKVDLALRAIADDLQRQRAGGGDTGRGSNDLLVQFERRIPEVEGMRITNAAGVVIYGKGVEGQPQASYAERDFFAYLRDHADSGLQVTKPIVGRISKKWIIAFVRRYNSADGRFGGVVSAAITLDHFNDLLSRFDIGPRGGITLRDTDLGQIARYPASPAGQAGMVGNTAVSPKLRALVQSGVPRATYHTRTPIDGTERILTFHRLRIAPMIATVGLAREDYLAEWHREVLKTALLVASFALLSLVSAALQIRFQKQNWREATRNQLYLKNASDGIHILDDSGVVVEASDSFCRMLGYERSEVIGMNVSQWDAQWPADIIISEVLPPLLTGDDTVVFETLNRRKNGDIFTVEVSAVGIVLEEKRYLFASSRDISERKHAEENVREKENRYRILFESANDGIFLLDATGFLDCNQRGASMYGLQREEVIGRSPIDFSPEQQPDGRLSSKVAAEKIQAAMGGEPQIFEWRSLRAAGVPFDVEITLNRIELGGSVCLQAIVRDITERIELQKEREKIQRLESLGVLAGGIAHDFNNILTGILGNISFARKLAGAEHKATKRLDECEKAARRAGELTRQLLTFARGGEPVRTAVDTGRIIEESLSFALRGGNVKGEVDCPSDIWRLDADAGQMSQVINNLLINAKQAMPHGGIVTVTAENVEVHGSDPLPVAPGRYVRISVTDRGSGIAPEHLAKIFDPYFTTKLQGSGLGLASVYSIIKRHGGMITAASRIGEGSTFTLLISATQGETNEYPVKDQPVAPLQGTGKILVMDDEEQIRDLLVSMLEDLGYGAEACADGSAAVTLHAGSLEKGSPFAAIILDLTVPGGMGGREAAELIRERDSLVPLIVSSGYSHDSVIGEYAEHGFSGLVIKPYTLEQLAAELARSMGRQSNV